MAQTFYFYDLETSGFNPREARIMQFGGQRTDLNLKPIGESHNLLIKLSDDILPDPDAIMVTGITPQQTLSDGMTEAEFLKLFHDEIALPDTIFTGFNSIRFDDEFMRYLHYRNFYDAYEWQWSDGRSKWDLLDLVRMVRALRPEGIQWPFDSSGAPSNRLELLTAVNKLDHADAHDALGDVLATIAVARMIRNKQTKLFDYLLSLRSKLKVAELVEAKKPFVYTSGQYSSEFEKTTVAVGLTADPKKQGMLVYDLRYDPTEYEKLSAPQLADLWRWKKDREEPRLPVKILKYNHCPAVAPLGVLDEASQKRLQLDLKVIKKHLASLAKIKDFNTKLLQALELLEKDKQTALLSEEMGADSQLYDGFVSDSDKTVMSAIRAAEPSDITNFKDELNDSRLQALLPLYKARNFPKSLTTEERADWERFRTQRLTGGGSSSRLARFGLRLEELGKRSDLTQNQHYLLEELQLYAQSILPAEFEG